MGYRREGDGFSVCLDGDRERPDGWMILWWRRQIQAKDNGHWTAGGEGRAGPISKLRNNEQRSLGPE